MTEKEEASLLIPVQVTKLTVSNPYHGVEYAKLHRTSWLTLQPFNVFYLTNMTTVHSVFACNIKLA